MDLVFVLFGWKKPFFQFRENDSFGKMMKLNAPKKTLDSMYVYMPRIYVNQHWQL